jgi:hypothetical protein
VNQIAQEEDDLRKKVDFDQDLNRLIDNIESVREAAEASSSVLGSIPIAGGFLKGVADATATFGAAAAKLLVNAKRYKVGAIANLVYMMYKEKADAISLYNRSVTTQLDGASLSVISSNLLMEMVGLRNQLAAVTTGTHEPFEPACYKYFRPLGSVGNLSSAFITKIVPYLTPAMLTNISLFPVHGVFVAVWPINKPSDGTLGRRLTIRMSVEDFNNKHESDPMALLGMVLRPSSSTPSFLNYDISVDEYIGSKWVTKYLQYFGNGRHVDWKTEMGNPYELSDNGVLVQRKVMTGSWRKYLCALSVMGSYDKRPYNLFTNNCQSRIQELENMVTVGENPDWYNGYAAKEYLKCLRMPITINSLDPAAPPITLFPSGIDPNNIGTDIPTAILTAMNNNVVIATANNMDGTITILDNNGNKLRPSDEFNQAVTM